MHLNYHQLHHSFSVLVPPGSVFELRLLGNRKGQTDSGYFNSASEAANALCAANGYYRGIYFTPNPVIPDALARSYNRITPYAQVQTHDPEILRRRWLLIDIDPVRPTGISSTDQEHENALKRALTIAGTLGLLFQFPDPVINDSGNGAHLMYPMDEENSNEVRDEIQTFLKILRAQYADPLCDIDTSVFNAARVWRVPGTWARKGDSTPERPHRQSAIVKAPVQYKRLSILSILRFNELNKNYLNQPAPGTKKNGSEYPSDEVLYKRLNEYAMRNIPTWVPHFFPAAREYKEGYRITSQELGLHYEEDLTIHPWPLGIKYFGPADQGDPTEGRRTPVSVIAEYSLHTRDKGEAAKRLSDVLNFPITELGPIDQVNGHAEVTNIGHSGIAGLLGTKPRFDFKSIRSIQDLQAKSFTPVRWIVNQLLPAGHMLLAARPKMRKTWLALQLCISIASGRPFLGFDTIQGDVLFLALEDNEKRIQSRIRTLQRFELMLPDLSGFRYWTGGMGYDAAGRLKVTDPEEHARTLEMFPRGEEGVEALNQYMEQYPQTSTIVIDTLKHFRGPRSSRDVYDSDYDAVTTLTKFASRHNVLVLSVTHEKKGLAAEGQGADFMEHVTGSAGMTGGTDGAMSIKGRRGVQEENESRKLLVSGRDIPVDYELDISFDAETGGWHRAKREDLKVAIRALLSRLPFANQRDLLNLLPGSTGQSRLYRVLTEMKMDGELEQGKYGYSLVRT